MKLRGVILPMLALVLFPGCDLLSGKCTYEIRSLEAGGSVSDGDVPLATAHLALSEQRGSLHDHSIYWLITGDALKGHVLLASLRDMSSPPSQVLLDLPVAGADRPVISEGAAVSSAGANLTGFHDILAADRGVIDLQTDLNTQPTVQVPVTVTSSSDWIRPYCS